MSFDPLVQQARYPDSPNPNSVRDGELFQDLVMEVTLRCLRLPVQVYTSAHRQLTQGESLQNFEIKFDRRCTETKRLSIEIAEKAKADNPSWIDSGIYRCSDETVYVQGNYEIIYYIMVRELKYWHKVNVLGKQKPLEWPLERPTIKRFFLPFDKANLLAWHVLQLPREGQPRLIK